MVWNVRKSVGNEYLTDRISASPATAVAIMSGAAPAPGLCNAHTGVRHSDAAGTPRRSPPVPPVFVTRTAVAHMSAPTANARASRTITVRPPPGRSPEGDLRHDTTHRVHGLA
eukprot:124003-Chlamydomonas_euryale.AAC.18